ncbi:hypothetical protein [Rossellomorea sp. NRS-1567]|uniref:hypothetical protein n=1 Tax=Rossellomorea sp. NRS-1567 TaxID=3233901 RepID=UPI003D2D68D3
MKTNVKNGIIRLRTMAVDDGYIHIGNKEDGKETFSYFPFETEVDGQYLILASTNGEGIVDEIRIVFPEYAMWEDEKTATVDIEPEDIFMKDGMPFED